MNEPEHQKRRDGNRKISQSTQEHWEEQEHGQPVIGERERMCAKLEQIKFTIPCSKPESQSFRARLSTPVHVFLREKTKRLGEEAAFEGEGSEDGGRDAPDKLRTRDQIRQSAQLSQTPAQTPRHRHRLLRLSNGFILGLMFQWRRLESQQSASSVRCDRLGMNHSVGLSVPVPGELCPKEETLPTRGHLGEPDG